MAQTTSLVFNGGVIPSPSPAPSGNGKAKLLKIGEITVTEQEVQVTKNVICDTDSVTTVAPFMEVLTSARLAELISANNILVLDDGTMQYLMSDSTIAVEDGTAVCTAVNFLGLSKENRAKVLYPCTRLIDELTLQQVIEVGEPVETGFDLVKAYPEDTEAGTLIDKLEIEDTIDDDPDYQPLLEIHPTDGKVAINEDGLHEAIDELGGAIDSIVDTIDGLDMDSVPHAYLNSTLNHSAGDSTTTRTTIDVFSYSALVGDCFEFEQTTTIDDTPFGYIWVEPGTYLINGSVTLQWVGDPRGTFVAKVGSVMGENFDFSQEQEILRNHTKIVTIPNRMKLAINITYDAGTPVMGFWIQSLQVVKLAGGMSQTNIMHDSTLVGQGSVADPLGVDEAKVAQSTLDGIKNLPDKNEGYLSLNDANGTGKFDIKKIFNNFAGKFVPNSTTTVAGQPYMYNGSLYVAKEAYQGAWDASKFITVSIFDLLKECGRFLKDGSVEGTKLAYSLFDFSKTLSPAFIRQGARLVAGQDTGYINATGYSIFGVPVKEGEYLHLTGHVDITTCFRFTTSSSQVTTNFFVSRFFNKYDNEDQYYDIIIQVPTGATYIQVTAKDSWGASLRMGTLKGFRGESLNEGSIEGTKLVNTLFGFSDSEKIAAARVREGAKLNRNKSSYDSAIGYNVVGYPVTAGTKIHISGKIDTDTTFRFTDSVDQVMPANFISFAFEKGTTTAENYDLFLDVPAGATYVQVTEKAAWGAEVYLCGNTVGIRGEALNDNSVNGEKLKKELYDYPSVESLSAHIRENAKLNAWQHSSYSVAEGYNVVGYPVTAGKKVRIVGKIDVTTSFRFTNSASQVMPANYIAMAYNQTAEGTVSYDLFLDVPAGATYVQVTEKAAWGSSVFSVEPKKKILASSVEGLKKIVSNSDVVTYTDLYVATSGNDTTGDGSKENPFATIFKANSVVSESDFNHRFRIHVADGAYDDLQTKYAGSTPTTYEGVVVAPYTEIIGNVDDPSKVILTWDGSYGYEEGVFNYNTYGFYKCLFHVTPNSKVCAIKGFTFDCKNTRYALHIEIDGYGKGVSWEVSDCIFKWGGVVNRMSTPTIGTGSGHFEKGLLQRCKIVNAAGVTDGFRNHDSNYKYSTNKVKCGPVIRIRDCDFGAGAQGDTVVEFRNIHNDSYVDGFDIVELENVVGISDFTYNVESPATVCKWRAKVFACEIDNDIFNANGFEN